MDVLQEEMAEDFFSHNPDSIATCAVEPSK